MSRLLKGEILDPVSFDAMTGIRSLTSHIESLKRNHGWKIQRKATVAPPAWEGGRVRGSVMYWMTPATVKAAGAVGGTFIDAVEQTAESN